MIAALLMLLFQAVQPPPDIVIFVLDDVACLDLALYGGSVSCPSIEGLAAAGVKFDRCYANPTCAPSRRSLFTGHWWVTGNGEPCTVAQPNTPTLAEVFLPECLPHLGGLVGKWHLGGDPLGGAWESAPISHGFNFWTAGSPSNVEECGGLDYSNWLKVTASITIHVSSMSTNYEPIVVRDSFDVGWPLNPSPKLGIVSENLAHSPFHAPPPNLLPPGYVVGPTVRAKFEAMLIAYDTTIGKMLTKIDLASTLVIVVGDNGTPPSAAPDRDKAKGTTFERGVRVPLIMAGGLVAAPGRTESALVHLVDIWSTCVEAGSGSIPGGSPYPLVGTSLMPSVLNQSHFPYHDSILIGSKWGDLDGDVASVSGSGIKLRWLDPDGNKTANTEELYDLAVDPAENFNQVNNPAYAADLASARAFLQASIP